MRDGAWVVVKFGCTGKKNRHDSLSPMFGASFERLSDAGVATNLPVGTKLM